MISVPPADGQSAVIETERLRMRPHRLDDWAASAAMWADPVVTRFVGGKPSTEEEAWTRFCRYIGHWALVGFGYWLVEDRATGDFIGEVGFADYKRGMEPSIHGVPEMGWVLASRAHGHGYATEAVRAGLAWGEAHFGPTRTVCIIDPGNAASIAVAMKCGYRQLQTAVYRGASVLLFERP
jgi:RimJ/RimL family protein N-acetyltransferase